MGFRTIIKEDWLTRKPKEHALWVTFILSAMLLIASYFFLNGILNANEWMPASGELVFKNHEYWRAWSTLFAHGDIVHILGNLFLFTLFSYFLTSYYHIFFFPILGFALGGVINLLVLKTMPEEVLLIGVSAVVYWMGAAWITLAVFIDRREPFKRRVLKGLGVSMLLFLPDSYRGDVSYLSHFLGYAFGVTSGYVYYLLRRKQFHAAEKVELVHDFNDEFDYQERAQADNQSQADAEDLQPS